MGLNQYSELLIYLKQLGENDVYINTILKGNEIDLNKADIYPVFNIVIDSASLKLNLAFQPISDSIFVESMASDLCTTHLFFLIFPIWILLWIFPGQCI